MLNNTTVVYSVTIEHNTLFLVYQTFHYVLFPCTSVLGIVGNGISIVILIRHGFRKILVYYSWLWLSRMFYF